MMDTEKLNSIVQELMRAFPGLDDQAALAIAMRIALLVMRGQV